MTIGTKIIRFMVAGLVLGGLAATMTTPAMAADKPIRWKVQSWFPLKLPHVGQQILDIGEKLERVSGGNIRLKAFEPGALDTADRVLRERLEGRGRRVLERFRLRLRQEPGVRRVLSPAVRAPMAGTASLLLLWRWKGAL